jgi:hypothetical protein
MYNKGMYYAELIDGVVVRVVVANNKSIVQKLGGVWKKTFFNNPNKTYAGIGYMYHAEHDDYSTPQPFPSWTLENVKWIPPTPKPEGDYNWDEETLAWIEENQI